MDELKETLLNIVSKLEAVAANSAALQHFVQSPNHAGRLITATQFNEQRDLETIKVENSVFRSLRSKIESLPTLPSK